MHCGGHRGSHFGYCAGCGTPIVAQEEAADRPIRGKVGRRGRLGARESDRKAELVDLTDQIAAIREQLAALTERLEEVGAEAQE